MPDTEFGAQAVVQRRRGMGDGVSHAERGKVLLELGEFAGELGRVGGGVVTGKRHDFAGNLAGQGRKFGLRPRVKGEIYAGLPTRGSFALADARIMRIKRCASA